MFQRIKIPVQHKGFPPGSWSFLASALTIVVICPIAIHLRGSHLELFLFLIYFAVFSWNSLRQFPQLVVRPKLGSISLKDMAWVTVEIRGEGEAAWFDPTGQPLPIAPQLARECWEALLANHGFPGRLRLLSPRIRLDQAEATEPMPRRFGEEPPERRENAILAWKPASMVPFYLFLLAMVVVLIEMVIISFDPFARTGLWVDAVILIGMGFIAVFLKIGQKWSLAKIMWNSSEQQWEFTQANDRVFRWDPKQSPSWELRWRMKRMTIGPQIQNHTFDLLLDDLAYSAWFKNHRFPPPLTGAEMEPPPR